MENISENKLVDCGVGIIPTLIEKIKETKGSIRGTIAMAIIRIGEPAIKYLRQEANINKEFTWIADYLINEIN